MYGWCETSTKVKYSKLTDDRTKNTDQFDRIPTSEINWEISDTNDDSVYGKQKENEDPPPKQQNNIMIR